MEEHTGEGRSRCGGLGWSRQTAKVASAYPFFLRDWVKMAPHTNLSYTIPEATIS